MGSRILLTVMWASSGRGMRLRSRIGAAVALPSTVRSVPSWWFRDFWLSVGGPRVVGGGRSVELWAWWRGGGAGLQPAAAGDVDSLRERCSLWGWAGGAVAAVSWGVGVQAGDVGVVLFGCDVSGVSAGDEGGPFGSGQLHDVGGPVGAAQVAAAPVGE